MRLRFTSRALVVGDRTGTVVPDAVPDVADRRIAWLGPASEVPPNDVETIAPPGIFTPPHGPARPPVWSGSGRHVRDVWPGGRRVVADGASSTVHSDALLGDVVRRAARLAAG